LESLVKNIVDRAEIAWTVMELAEDTVERMGTLDLLRMEFGN